MAMSKKDAKKALPILQKYIKNPADLKALLTELLESDIKNKSVRKSLKRIHKQLERPKKAESKKAA